MVQPQLIIGICGGSGSGKTTFVRQVLDQVPAEQVALLELDAYFKNRSELPRLADGTENWDHPDSLDLPLFNQHLGQLSVGVSVDRPVYDFATHRRQQETVLIEPAPVLILEGVLLLATEAVRSQLNLIVYLDVAADVRLVRRLRRDILERGRTPESVLDQYQQTVGPMHHEFVEPGRHYAHVIVPWHCHNLQAVELLSAQVRSVGPAGSCSRIEERLKNGAAPTDRDETAV